MQNLKPKIPGVSLNHIVPTPESELLTGVPVFFGLASSDNNEPKKLTLRTQFDQYFSQIEGNQGEGYLKNAIKGFFENGGRLCYVVALENNSLDNLKQALEASELLENTDLICFPDIMLVKDSDEIIKMQQAVLEHCEYVGNRFAILDALNVNDVEKLDWQRKKFSSNYGALYAPWLKVENRPDFIPPCGHVAGIYANSDSTGGVHHAPANIELEDVINLSISLTPTEQEQLNPETQPGINCIRSFRGRGMRVWGVRTLSPLPEWQYINVRRLFITFRRWANFNLADTVFESNTFSLWIRLERELSVYCESLWLQGALKGTLPQEAFYVKCDEETNPPENREMGQVVAEDGLAPTVPGEFIQLLLVQSSSGISIN